MGPTFPVSGVWLIYPVTFHWSKQIFPFPKCYLYHLQIVSWLGVGFCAHLPSCLLGFCLTWACRSLTHAVTVSVSSYVQLLCCVCKELFLQNHLKPLSLTTFWLLFCIDPWTLRGVLKTSDARLSTLKSAFLYIKWLRINYSNNSVNGRERYGGTVLKAFDVCWYDSILLYTYWIIIKSSCPTTGYEIPPNNLPQEKNTSCSEADSTAWHCFGR